MADITRPRAVFAPADYKLISRALEHYKNHLVRLEESERASSLELTQLANLMHRLGRR
jgi:hypothetical protein